jgi:hypothetical protein
MGDLTPSFSRSSMMPRSRRPQPVSITIAEVREVLPRANGFGELHRRVVVRV